MARLVAVCRSDDYPYERRQIPLVVDDNLTMVLQFSDSCIGCETANIKQKDFERFVHKFRLLSNDEASRALTVSSKEIFNLLAQLVPCVGCRRSVERLFNQLVESGHPALEPLVVSSTAFLSIKRDYLADAKHLYKLFYVHGSNLNNVIESIPKSKKNKRCMLHSLDTHKTKALGSWVDIWDVLSKECREEVILVDCEDLIDTLDNYLRKHRFCSECKSKVLRAYHILVGELESTAEKGYCPALYEGLRCCQGERHIHVLCEKDFIAQLIGRAEPELTGSSRRERHAKTLDIAQEEVLTCLGIYLYERLHRIWQKLRAEEQTWQILFFFGVNALKKSFEMALEQKQGISNLELICKELLEEEQAKEQRREQKRQKRKKKKGNKTNINVEEEIAEADLEKDKENCTCDDLNTGKGCVYADSNSNEIVSLESCTCNSSSSRSLIRDTGTGNRSDCGYSSGHDGCESCSIPSSRDGSDVACSEGICNHDGDSPLCRAEVPDQYWNCPSSASPSADMGCSPRHQYYDHKWQPKCGTSPGHSSESPCLHRTDRYRTSLTLQDMLEASCSSGEEEDFISEEEIRRFKANASQLNTKRQQLRETLRQRFANMQRAGGCTALCSAVNRKLTSATSVMKGHMVSGSHNHSALDGCSNTMVTHINNLSIN